MSPGGAASWSSAAAAWWSGTAAATRSGFGRGEGIAVGAQRLQGVEHVERALVHALQVGLVPVDARDGRIEIAGAMRRAPQLGQIDRDGGFAGIVGRDEIVLVRGIDRMLGRRHAGGFGGALGRETGAHVLKKLAEGLGILACIGRGFGIKPVAMRVAPHVGLAARRARAGGSLRVGPVGRGLGIGNQHDKGTPYVR